MNPGIILLLGLLVLVYMNYSGRRRAQRTRLALQERLVPGAQIVTSSGLHATVTQVDEDGTVLLQSAPGHVMRWEKLAVSRIVASPADAVAETADGRAGRAGRARTRRARGAAGGRRVAPAHR